jgi:uncharacterized protein (DUF2252 family)
MPLRVPPSALSVKARYEVGKRLRQRLPRDAQAECQPFSRSPQERLQVLAQVNRGRLARLLPEKYRRMRRSPFAFFRGSAVLMGADLTSHRHTGLTVQLCGDAHVRNLGAYAAPDGTIVFDINDFDETIPGPWEWDVKRFATSLVLAGEEAGQRQVRCEGSVRLFMASYRAHLRGFAAMPLVELARHLITRRPDDAVLAEIVDDARRVTPRRNLRKLTVPTRSGFRFHDKKPDLEHVSPRTAAAVVHALKGYRDTLSANRRRLFERYRPADVAFKLVGTGSVGTRDYVVLLFGNDTTDPLFMQVKQEIPSCYAPYLRSVGPVDHEGRRVSEGQQMMQTLSDPLLGYTRFDGHDYLVRQLADHKAALDPSQLDRRTLFTYATLCGEVLARAHARTTDAATLAGYVGAADTLDRAIAEFAAGYAVQTKADFTEFARALRRRKASGSPV